MVDRGGPDRRWRTALDGNSGMERNARAAFATALRELTRKLCTKPSRNSALNRRFRITTRPAVATIGQALLIDERLIGEILHQPAVVGPNRAWRLAHVDAN